LGNETFESRGDHLLDCANRLRLESMPVAADGEPANRTGLGRASSA
jgi:hypothetical protein